MADPYEYEDFSGSGYGRTPTLGAGMTSKYLDAFAGVPMQTFAAPLSNRGNPTSEYWNKIYMTPDTPIRVVDNATGKVVYEGVGYDAAQKASEIASSLSQSGGNKANWDIQTVAPNASGFATIAHEKPNNSALGMIADIGLPIAAGFIPGVGPILGAALGSGVSSVAQGRSLKDTLLRAGLSAAGSAAGGSLFGNAASPLSNSAIQNISDLAVQNAVSAGSSALGGGLGGAIGGAAGSSLGSAAGSLADDIIVTALNSGVSGLGGALGSAIGSGIGNVVSNVAAQPPAAQPSQQPQQPGDEIVVNAQPPAPLYEVPAVAGAGALGGATAAAQQPSTQPPQPGDEIIVNARQTPTVPVPDVGSLAGGALAGLPNLVNDLAATTGPKLTDTIVEPKSDLEKIAEYARLAGLGVTALGSLFGGGAKSGAAGTIPAGLNGGLDPIFSAKLPTGPANIPGGVGTAANFAVRPQTEQDWLTYGQRPEQSFFNYVPQPTGMAHGGKVMHDPYDTLTPEEKNFVDYHRRNMAVMPYEHDGGVTTVRGMVNGVQGGEMLYPSYVHGRLMDADAARDWAVRSGIGFPVYPDAKTALAREKYIHDNVIDPDTARYQRGDRGWLKGYSHGGRSAFAVHGPGTGRSDDIPAVLSDGEYVMDAETVALLGDGSSKAGAQKLDDLRVKIRKHKGQKLAQGRFSANAKHPEAYLSGGRI